MILYLVFRDISRVHTGLYHLIGIVSINYQVALQLIGVHLILAL